MNHVENYKNILENIFQQIIEFSNVSFSNNCIGALNNTDNFHVFRNNFIDRLKRLNAFFSSSPKTIREIINTAKQIGQTKGYKWSGPYSELVALDYWIQFENLMNIKFVDRGSVDHFGESIAKRVGLQEIDLDISFDLPFCRIFTDVKSLIPTHLELVEKIFNKLQSETAEKDYLIGIDDLFEVDYLRTKKDYLYELESGTLIQELEACINNKTKFYEHKLQSGMKAKFRIAYVKLNVNTVLSTTRYMKPHRLAMDYKYKILDYYNKLLTKKPSFITFVANPWFNREMNDFSGFNETFYKALSRRVFIELTKDNEDMEDYYPELLNKGLKISDVASLVTGIIFINDNSNLKTGKDINDTYIFLNPNAKNRIFREHDFNVLNWSPNANQPLIEDFKYDNY